MVAGLGRAAGAVMAHVGRARTPRGDDDRQAQAHRAGARAASRADRQGLKNAAKQLLTQRLSDR